MLGFVDNLKFLGSLLNDTKRAAQVLEQAIDKVGLNINREKTKMIKLLENEENTNDDDNEYSF